MRGKAWFASGLVALILTSLASAELVSRVQLEDAGSLGESDIGVKTGAVSPNGEDILVAGMNGYARLLSAEDAGNRALDIELVTGRSSTIQDIAWHPSGNTAIMVGDGGFAMRYDSNDHSVTYVNGSFSVSGYDLTSVVWRPGGDFAYIASTTGQIWKFAEHIGFELLDNLGESHVADIACQRNDNICVLGTYNEGMAIIDKGHALTWLGQTAAQTWVGVDCASPVLNECVGFASGLVSKVVSIDTQDTKQSTVEPAVQIGLPSGDYVKVSRGHDGTNLAHIAPLGLVRYMPMSGEAFAVLLQDDAADWDEVIAGRSLAVVWENSFHNGYIITDYGNIIAFSPAVEEVEMNIIDVLVLGAVAVSVPGVILGLIYMNSPWLQRKYRKLRFGKK